MLEAINLIKIYKPKKGVPVKALDGINLILPERGMVFILGKSGSGKSTLLNVLGGLDKYDDGEIIIKGVSSKDFTQQRFDSYRNTYVGFIFQEYNVLNEFNVGANIALALELQGKRATDEEINKILHEVDLDGYGSRKPNELSVGQLQRVAIARALVKNPEIIMADEPTGALDSNTGRQVLDTLKRLSETKLVVVVSHDREYAEQYADRIIELADGKIINDVEHTPEKESGAKPTLEFKEDTVEIPASYHLTEEDRQAINDYIAALNSGVKLRFTGMRRRFTPTDTSAIKREDGSTFKLIKSKLPLRSAFRIGGNSLGHKKFRLVVTIILSVVAFTLFALADTFSSYNHVKTCTNSIIDSNINYASVKLSKRIGEGINAWWLTWGYKLSDDNIAQIKNDTGLIMKGVFVPEDKSLSFKSHFNNEVEFTKSDYNIYIDTFSGFVEITNSDLDNLGYKLVAGTLPDGGKNEIAISDLAYKTFSKAGYTDGTYTVDEEGKATISYQDIKSYNDIVGKTLKFGEDVYTITGVIDTGFGFDRYLSLTEESTHNTTAEQLIDYFLYNEWNYAARYSFSGVAFVGDGYVDSLIAQLPNTVSLSSSSLYLSSYDETRSMDVDPYHIARLSDIDKSLITWVDGVARDTLGDKEIVVTTDCVYLWSQDGKWNGTITYSNDTSVTDWTEIFSNVESLNISAYSYYDNDEPLFDDGWRIVGYIDKAKVDTNLITTAIVPEYLYNKLATDSDGVYEFAVGPMPKAHDELMDFVSYCYNEDDDTRYTLQNAVTYELDTVHSVLETLSTVFLYIGIGFAAFAALMLANFIATSIAYKKQEIGILRAIGSRSNDVFRIFFSESFIIAMINFVISAIATLSVTLIINSYIRDKLGVLITVLNFGVRQVALLFALSIVVATLASFLPVKKIASKRPIDAIRGR